MPQHETPSEAEQRRARARATSIVHVIERNQTAAQKHKTCARLGLQASGNKPQFSACGSSLSCATHMHKDAFLEARIAQ